MILAHTITALFLAMVPAQATAMPADTTKVKALKIRKVDRSNPLVAPGDLSADTLLPAKPSAAKRNAPAKKVAAPKEAPAEPAANSNKAPREIKENSAACYATFPGGDVAVMKFTRAHMQYPEECKSERLTGRTEVALTVEPDGTVSNIKLHKCSGNAYMDREALRVAGLLPKWEPAKEQEYGKQLEYIVIFNFRPGR